MLPVEDFCECDCRKCVKINAAHYHDNWWLSHLMYELWPVPEEVKTDDAERR